MTPGDISLGERTIHMKMRRMTVLAAAAILTACAGDGTGPEGGLSSSEASQLAAAILDLSLDASLADGSGPSGAPAAAPAAAPSSFDERVSGEGPCPLGGTVFADLHAFGTFDDATEQGKLTFEVEAKHHGCQVKAKESGQLFVIDGSPSVKVKFQMEAKANQTLALSGSYDGASV
jgi:hypothetical protein